MQVEINKHTSMALRVALFLFLGTASMAYAQNECAAMFKRATDKAAHQRSMLNKQGFQMSCMLKITYENNTAFTDRMEIQLNGNRYAYTSRSLNLYQDDKNMVTVQHDPKMVFITRSKPAAFQETQFTQVLAVVDSLQRHIELIGCSKEFGAVKSDQGYHKVLFKPSSDLKNAGIKSLAYWINSDSEAVEKIMLEYTEGNAYGIRKYEMIVEKLDYAFSGVPFQGEALKKVMSNSNVLKPEFAGYELIDKRQ